MLVAAWATPVEAFAPRLIEPRAAASKITVVIMAGGFKVLCKESPELAKIKLPGKRHMLMSFHCRLEMRVNSLLAQVMFRFMEDSRLPLRACNREGS
jgi:hypothetical protein